VPRIHILQQPAPAIVQHQFRRIEQTFHKVDAILTYYHAFENSITGHGFPAGRDSGTASQQDARKLAHYRLCEELLVRHGRSCEAVRRLRRCRSLVLRAEAGFSRFVNLDRRHELP